MSDEPVPRQLPERTGRHLCTVCLNETSDREYFANDHCCDRCANVDQDFPLASTPGAPAQQEKKG